MSEFCLSEVESHLEQFRCLDMNASAGKPEFLSRGNHILQSAADGGSKEHLKENVPKGLSWSNMR